MADSLWTITVNELFNHRGGCSIYSTFSVSVAPDTTLQDFSVALRDSPKNKDPSSTTLNNLKPFDPKKIGTRDRERGGIVAENPDAQPNCSWNHASARTIQEAGLCDGAVLAYYTRRIRD